MGSWRELYYMHSKHKKASLLMKKKKKETTARFIVNLVISHKKRFGRDLPIAH